MKYCSLLFCFLPFLSFSQFQSTTSPHAQYSESHPDRIASGTFLGTTIAISSIAPSEPNAAPEKIIQNFKTRGTVGPLEYNPNPKKDPVWQETAPFTRTKAPTNTIIYNANGIGYSNVQPPDPAIEVGPNHVVQLVNGSGGTRMTVRSKTGTVLQAPTSINSFWNSVNATGGGDPIALYDRNTNRWFITEFANSGNELLIAASTTASPTGTYNAYSFNTTNFPDYPKYAIWDNAVTVTTNENASRVYAFDKSALLSGASSVTMLSFSVTNLSSFGFQALTPVEADGSTAPPSGTKATFWRHRDDEAHNWPNNNPNADFVEYWTLTPNFSSPNQSTFSGPSTITVAEFDSDLNGYYAFSAIEQPGSSSPDLDPLREVFMNRMQYMNNGSYESIVGCHVTDVNGQDRAGMRWYEFRKSGNSWSLYQQGTYSPDATNRWMGAISMDDFGNIGMAYCVSSPTVYPSIKYTGRAANDPLGTMTLVEQNVVTGGGSNQNNRYGDYSTMVLDPADDQTFWFTGEYNPGSTWSTRIVAFKLSSCNGLTLSATVTQEPDCHGEADGVISAQGTGGNQPLTYSIDGNTYQSSNLFTNLSGGSYTVYVKDATGCIVETSSVIVSEPNEINTATTQEQPTCNGYSNGSITANGTGGTGSLVYSLNGSSFSTSNTFSNLNAGTYTITTRDASGCLDTLDNIVLGEPNVLSFSTQEQVPNNGQSNGIIEVNGTGGTRPYTYKMNSGTPSSDSVFSNLSAGVYIFEITDANNCTYSNTVNLTSSNIGEVKQNKWLSIAPNPTSGAFTVIYTGMENAAFELYSVTGTQIKTGEFLPQETQQFDLRTFANGSYILKVAQENSTEEYLIIKED